MADDYDDLPDDVAQGVTRQLWESWTPSQRMMLVRADCAEDGCSNPPWRAAGSLYCEEHTREHSARWGEGIEQRKEKPIDPYEGEWT